MKARGINETTCKLYDYTVGEYKGEACQTANLYNDKGQVMAQKLRFKDKRFVILGDNSKALMFGQRLLEDRTAGR